MMNRREFTRNMLAAATIPALPVPSLAKTAPLAVPKAARFWAIYMTHMHGDVTPGMLTQMTGIAPAQTTAIRAKLIADKVIAPTGFIQKSLASKTILKSQQQNEATLSKIKTQSEKLTKFVEETDETVKLSENTEPEPIEPLDNEDTDDQVPTEDDPTPTET